ncbi:hypothetical protein ANME2D_02336 [Candidatus Methanoperedens nitroreducens]|uniref:Uncharacterized protein n=1 Tax=Candidatus Methanoperedens nitratireducens TaxID=1392998 RepID=A0A062UX78_9EURY|nr:hypothetical protein [Candidatus Methanoperedens nitroreducens]KCZ71601.1 hypothetical protein ANME2D_02336 [Candidatus Methanoperedens nitroreducens]MDJ1421231.1 hypothetical protein [Candidatus Methanoperedens sp.]
MADINAFPTIRHVLHSGDNIKNFKAGAAITAGMVVAFESSGVSRQVIPAVKGSTGMPIGVALYGVSSGDEVAVACRGCWVYVANADDTTGIDAGDALEDNDNAVKGTVSAAALVEAGAVAVVKYQIGIAIDDIAGGGTGLMEVAPGHLTAANNA